MKLMAGFGALLGPGRLLEAALWTAGVGGILAVCAIAWKSLMSWRKPPVAAADLTPEEKDKAASIPYAPAIALGVWLSLIPKG
mgnify:FL=1